MSKSWLFSLNPKSRYWSPNTFQEFIQGINTSKIVWHCRNDVQLGDTAYIVKTSSIYGVQSIIAYGTTSKVWIDPSDNIKKAIIDFIAIIGPGVITIDNLISKGGYFKDQCWTPQKPCIAFKDDSIPIYLKKRFDSIPSQNNCNQNSQQSSTNTANMASDTNTAHHPLNLILYGPPGTGKTYNTINYAVAIIENKDISTIEKEDRKEVRKRYLDYVDKGQIVFTTFHQSLSYEEFIEGIKPIPPKGNEQTILMSHSGETSSRNPFGDGTTIVDGLEMMTYEVKPGIFKRLCEKAQAANDSFVLIIDEINRGNVSQIFGELITLIEEDKRLGESEALTVKLPYSGDEFGVPNNLYIIGTMNTADRSVEALDTALRRRFSFKEMMPKPELLKNKVCDYALKDILETINKRIRVLKDREHQIGHSYFMKCKSVEDLRNVFKNNIVPLLQEYFYGNYAYIGLVLGEGFVKPDTEANNPQFANLSGSSDEPDIETAYRLLNDDEWNTLADSSAMENALKWMNVQTTGHISVEQDPEQV